MTRLAIILAMLPSLVWAQTTHVYGPGCGLRLEATETGAVLHIRNSLIPALDTAGDTVTVTVNGIAVEVVADMQPGDEADTWYVYAPEGYISVPWSVTIEENRTADVQIVPTDSVAGW